MMNDWYLRQKDQVSGPFSWEELRFLSEQAKIAAADGVRCGTHGDWLSAESVPGLLKTAVRDPAPVARVAPRANRPPAPAALPPAPPPLPPPRRATSEQARRRTIVAIVAATGALAGLLCLLLATLVFWFSTTISRDGSGDDGGGTASADAAGSPEQSEGGEEAGDPPGMSDIESLLAKPANGPSRQTPSQQAPPKPPPQASVGDGTAQPPPPPPGAVMIPADEAAAPDDPADAAGGSAEFFAIKSVGRRFVYVVDCSGSMEGERFAKARGELQRSIDRLNARQSFCVIFFDDVEYPQFHPRAAEGLLRASAENKQRLREWASGFRPPGGGTNPGAALTRALSLEPDAVYLLTDGVFDEQWARVVRDRNGNRASIHTISFMTREAEPLLKRIAQENRGSYRFVP